MRKYLKKIVPAFLEQNREAMRERSVSFQGNRLYSYDTLIAVIEKHASGTALFINKTKYSMTTSTLQNTLRYFAVFQEDIDVVHEMEEEEFNKAVRTL